MADSPDKDELNDLPSTPAVRKWKARKEAAKLTKEADDQRYMDGLIRSLLGDDKPEK